MPYRFILLLGFFLTSFLSRHSLAAGEFSKQCVTLEQCVETVSKLTGQKYFFHQKTKSKLGATSNLSLTKDNAEVLFTKALHSNSLTRIPVEGNSERLLGDETYQIVKVKQALESVLPKVRGSKSKPPILPPTWDYFMMIYEVSEADRIHDMARTVRSFAPEASRVVSYPSAKKILVAASAPELRSLYEILKELDD